MDIKKYSNQTKRDVAKHIWDKGLESEVFSKRFVMESLDIYLANKRLRTPEELEQDKIDQDKFERMSNGSYYTE